MASFGFTFLSRKALGQAEQMMFGDKAGVRDEVGFLIIHQRYADHFFPGTSVLHTRLRYALFIPWLYQTLRNKRPVPKDFVQAFRDLEHQLTGRLKYTDPHGGERDGVIGAEFYPRAISQPPSYVYWTALSKWGLINPHPGGRILSRPDMAKLLAAAGRRILHDDDGKPFESIDWPLPALIAPPANWEDWGAWDQRYGDAQEGKLSLTMSAPEQDFMARKLRAIRAPGNPAEQALLGKLVGKPLDAIAHCWDDSILSLAGDEAPMLQRAGQAAALAAIGRAIYAALVETLKHKTDQRQQNGQHRDALGTTIATWGAQAAELDMDLFLQDVGHLPAPVAAVVQTTLDWLRQGHRDPAPLLGVYARAEISRKGDRARLADTQFGADRRMEWQAEKHGNPDPLRYRWGNVKRLLRDLGDAV